MLFAATVKAIKLVDVNNTRPYLLLPSFPISGSTLGPFYKYNPEVYHISCYFIFCKPWLVSKRKQQKSACNYVCIIRLCMI